MTAIRMILTLIGGAAILAATALGLTAPTAGAVWDLEAYDICMGKTIRYPADCCIMSGGDLGDDGKCYAPANAQSDPVKPPPGSLGVPGTVHTRPGKVSTQP